MTKETSDSVLIVGTGALACLFAARLSAAGIKVSMLGTWREGLAALRMYGVTIVKLDGKQTSYPVTVFDQASDCQQAKYALVLVKSWQTERAANQLSNCLSPEGIALTLQNGLGNHEILASTLGAERTAQGVTTTGATLLSSGRVRPGGKGIVTLGTHLRLDPLQKILNFAGFNLEIQENVAALIWGKLATNAAINPLTALLKMPNGEVISRPSARQLSADLAREVAAVAQAKGIAPLNSDPVGIAAQVAAKTSDNLSSMYQDILRGAPTEIDAICGAVVAAGEEFGVPTPTNYAMWKLIHAVVEGQD